MWHGTLHPTNYYLNVEYDQERRSVEAWHPSIQFVQLKNIAQIACCYAVPAPPCVEYSLQCRRVEARHKHIQFVQLLGIRVGALHKLHAPMACLHPCVHIPNSLHATQMRATLPSWCADLLQNAHAPVIGKHCDNAKNQHMLTPPNFNVIARHNFLISYVPIYTSI